MAHCNKTNRATTNLELVQELLAYGQGCSRASQDDLEAILKAQAITDLAEPLESQRGQGQRGDAQEHHWPVVGRAASGGAEKALHHLQRFHGGVLLEPGAAHSRHQCQSVVLHQHVGPDDGTVQLGKPEWRDGPVPDLFKMPLSKET